MFRKQEHVRTEHYQEVIQQHHVLPDVQVLRGEVLPPDILILPIQPQLSLIPLPVPLKRELVQPEHYREHTPTLHVP